jgi:ankyrin repeat protein
MKKFFILLLLLSSRSQGMESVPEDNQDSFPSLIKATYAGNVEAIKRLLEKGADINQRDASGDTSLILAARFGKLGVVKILLEKGADINATNRRGDTALNWAIGNEHKDIVKLLLEKRAKITTQEVADWKRTGNNRDRWLIALLEKELATPSAQEGLRHSS